MSTTKSRFTGSEPTESGELTTIYVDGQATQVKGGTTVAAALLGHDDDHFCHSAEKREKRSPYCLMGVCFECLVEIDGIKNRQACLEPIREGMQVKRQHIVEGDIES